MLKFFANKARMKVGLPQQLDMKLVNSFPTIFFLPCMTYKEMKLLERSSKPSKSVVEFGAGGSTIHFLKENKKVVSVENNKPYIDYLITIDLIRKKIDEKQLSLNYVNTGEVRKWGKPIDELNKNEWPQYYTQVWEKLKIEAPDLLLIDGRFRVMCALCAIPYIKEDTCVLFHDFTKPKKYNSILEFFDIIDCADSLYVLKIKDTIDKECLESMKKEFQFDYR
ncbi:hypothetical protein [uncultured Pontibacter sp.]|uniref:hypothetical protein n=1 Tax=uncultured Pontibacter sp. TaxID=453356 RepID=UPI00263A32F9|nr:hypothetical protein [uncultured Pontibacter sp.]